jgi:hypothetical protein
MTISLSSIGLLEEGFRDRSHWFQHNSLQKGGGLVVKDREIEMPTGKQDLVENSSSSEGSSIRETSDLPTLEVDDEMGNVQGNMGEGGEEPEQHQYGLVEGGGAAARTVYHQPLSDRDTL